MPQQRKTYKELSEEIVRLDESLSSDMVSLREKLFEELERLESRVEERTPKNYTFVFCVKNIHDYLLSNFKILSLLVVFIISTLFFIFFPLKPFYESYLVDSINNGTLVGDSYDSLYKKLKIKADDDLNKMLAVSFSDEFRLNGIDAEHELPFYASDNAKIKGKCEAKLISLNFDINETIGINVNFNNTDKSNSLVYDINKRYSESKPRETEITIPFDIELKDPKHPFSEQKELKLFESGKNPNGFHSLRFSVIGNNKGALQEGSYIKFSCILLVIGNLDYIEDKAK